MSQVVQLVKISPAAIETTPRLTEQEVYAVIPVIEKTCQSDLCEVRTFCRPSIVATTDGRAQAIPCAEVGGIPESCVLPGATTTLRVTASPLSIPK